MTLPLQLPDALSRQLRTARQMVRQRRRGLDEEQLPTACAAFDQLLEGGLRRGSMVELIGQRSSGRFSLVLSALAATTGRGEAAALIDLGDAFDPQVAHHAAVDLERLLWIRPRHLKEVLASAEIILSSGIPLVVIDLGMPPIAGGRGHEASWLRLARRALAHRAALLVASPYRVSGTAAQAVINAKTRQSRWLGTGSTPRLLAGCAASLELLKSRSQRPGAPRQGDRQEIVWRSGELLAPEWLDVDTQDDEARHPETTSRPAAHIHPFRRPLDSSNRSSRRAIA